MSCWPSRTQGARARMVGGLDVTRGNSQVSFSQAPLYILDIPQYGTCQDDNKFEKVKYSVFIGNRRVIQWPREDMKQLRSGTGVHSRGYKPYTESLKLLSHISSTSACPPTR